MKYFTIKELTKSQTAILRNIDNTPSEEIIKNINNLVDYILDPLREAYGEPIIVTSGYRSKELNVVIGGSKTSQHKKGLAADIRTIKDTPTENKKLYDLIILLNLPFDLLINEYNFNWVHVSFSNNPRRLILKT